MVAYIVTLWIEVSVALHGEADRGPTLPGGKPDPHRGVLVSTAPVY